ncbi:MAG: DEAD/DEAH box helicase [Verrucomicrobiae bacterium]|nr:DEAD/DEAH box helicase [Verrucomicrobiae bacterium]
MAAEFAHDNPLIVQSDLSLLVEVKSPRYTEARDALASFAELVKSPEHIHTYRITPLSVWNACASGDSAKSMIAVLHQFARYDVPMVVDTKVNEWASRYGKLRLVRVEGELFLTASDPAVEYLIVRNREINGVLGEHASGIGYRINPDDRGRLKQVLVKAGYPAEDLAGYRVGEPLAVALRQQTTMAGATFALRDYQIDAVDRFHAGGSERGGSGVVVLPCGAGKTVVGLACMEKVGASALILTNNATAARQWIAEILDKTELDADEVGEYTGQQKHIRPVTVTTYQILTWRERKADPFRHMALFDERDWGLIIYDEVHLLPAPVFQATAGLQARRRLGLTATLVREDGREDDVFALIGPKKADVPWKVLEGQGWIAGAQCYEVRLPLDPDLRMDYALADKRAKFRVASENPAKLAIVTQLLKKHATEQVLVIGMYVDQLKLLAADLGCPIIQGSTSQKKREELFGAFRSGDLRVLVVSKVANFAIDLPDASVAIQVSGTFGSRQEEAQRLGRILRPKPGANRAWFYTLVSRDTVEQDFALNRQMFLCEQGYDYEVLDEIPQDQS